PSSASSPWRAPPRSRSTTRPRPPSCRPCRPSSRPSCRRACRPASGSCRRPCPWARPGGARRPRTPGRRAPRRRRRRSARATRAGSSSSNSPRHRVMPSRSLLRPRDDRVGIPRPWRRSARLVTHHPDRLPGGIEEEEGRVALDAVLALERVVLLLQLRRQRLAGREVELEQDHVLLRPLLERGLVEDLGLELLAPAAPVAAGEVGENQLLLRLRRRERRLVVRHPSACSHGRLPSSNIFGILRTAS